MAYERPLKCVTFANSKRVGYFVMLIKCDFLNMIGKICLRHKHDYAIMFTFLYFLNMR